MLTCIKETVLILYIYMCFRLEEATEASLLLLSSVEVLVLLVSETGVHDGVAAADSVVDLVLDARVGSLLLSGEHGGESSETLLLLLLSHETSEHAAVVAGLLASQKLLSKSLDESSLLLLLSSGHLLESTEHAALLLLSAGVGSQVREVDLAVVVSVEEVHVVVVVCLCLACDLWKERGLVVLRKEGTV